jgi:hypothetical protein
MRHLKKTFWYLNEGIINSSVINSYPSCVLWMKEQSIQYLMLTYQCNYFYIIFVWIVNLVFIWCLWLYVWEVAEGKVYPSFVACVRTVSSSYKTPRVVNDIVHYSHPNNKHFEHKIHFFFKWTNWISDYYCRDSVLTFTILIIIWLP